MLSSTCVRHTAGGKTIKKYVTAEVTKEQNVSNRLRSRCGLAKQCQPAIDSSPGTTGSIGSRNKNTGRDGLRYQPAGQ